MKTRTQLLEALRAGELDASPSRAELDALLRLDVGDTGPAGAPFELRDAGGAVLTKARRRELLRALGQGEPIELRLEGVVYRQSLTPRPLPIGKRAEANLNHVGFEPDALEQLASSFRGRPFLRDHNRRELGAVGGEIKTSVARTSGNWLEFRQELHLVSGWAVRAALDGTLRTFSIGWQLRRGAKFRDSLLCSVCAGPWIGGDCKHWPGEEAKLDSGARVIVELIWRNIEGAETSGVSFPAVSGTKVDDVTALAEQAPAEGKHSPAELVALAVAQAPGTDAEALERELRANRDYVVRGDMFVSQAIREGKMRREHRAVERAIRMQAGISLEAGAAFVASLTVLYPPTPVPAPTPSAANGYGLTAHQRALCEKNGIDLRIYRELLDQEVAEKAAARTAPTPTAAVPTSARRVDDTFGKRLVERALREAKLHPDDSQTRDELMALARRDPTAAEQHVRGMGALMTERQLAMARQVGVSPESWLHANQPVPEETYGLTERQLELCRQAGLTPAQWRLHNPE